MGWSAETSEGFVLAATIAGDRLGVQGLRGLAGKALTSSQALSERLGELPTHERRMQVEAISQRLNARVSAVCTELPPRALALLAPLAERGLADTWLARAPTPRLGYRAEAGLRQVLRMIAEHGSWRA